MMFLVPAANNVKITILNPDVHSQNDSIGAKVLIKEKSNSAEALGQDADIRPTTTIQNLGQGTNDARGLNIFYKYSNSQKTPHKIKIPLQIQTPEELTKNPVTLGDHLRRRRLELGLYQKDVAIQIGVTTSTIWNWEHGWTVELRFIPRVIEFLGYNPIPCPSDLLPRLAWYKQVNGLTLEKLGEEMGRDPEQLADWLSDRHMPCGRNKKEIGRFLRGKCST